MTEQDQKIVKVSAFLEMLDYSIAETLAAGVSEISVRRTLLARAIYQFMSPEAAADGIAALGHFRKVLEQEIASSSGQAVG